MGAVHHEGGIDVNGDGSAPETLVQLRIDAAGSDPLRVEDADLESQSVHYRLEILDGEGAPNTAEAGGLPNLEAEFDRLGDLVGVVEDYEAEYGDGATSGRAAGSAGASDAKPSSGGNKPARARAKR